MILLILLLLRVSTVHLLRTTVLVDILLISARAKNIDVGEDVKIMCIWGKYKDTYILKESAVLISEYRKL